MEGKSILTASFPEFIHELSLSSARENGVSLEIDVSEDKRQSGWAVSRGQVQSGKEESWEVFFLSEMALRSLKTARGSERGDRLEQVACQVADLALEMTEDALQEASMYLRRCDSDRCATERGPPSFPNCRFRFLGPPGFGGNDQGGQRG